MTQNPQTPDLTITQVEVQDFVPGEDSLAIDISSFTEGGKYQLIDVDLAEATVPQSGTEGGLWYSATLSLLEQGQTEPFEAIVEFRSTGGEVTLDDIAILTGVAA